MEEWQSGAEILKNLGLRFKDYRLRLNLTQKEVSEKTAISVPTIYKFENGRLNDMSTSNLMKLIRIVGLQSNWDKLLPELPESPQAIRDIDKVNASVNATSFFIIKSSSIVYVYVSNCKCTAYHNKCYHKACFAILNTLSY